MAIYDMIDEYRKSQSLILVIILYFYLL